MRLGDTANLIDGMRSRAKLAFVKAGYFGVQSVTWLAQ